MSRRADCAAIIVTYAQRRTHDYSYFERWRYMVKGAVRPPVIRINNVKIARRHVHAQALAEYYRHHPDTFVDRLESLFDPTNMRTREILQFLYQRPLYLQKKLKRIIPQKLHKSLGLDDWEWLKGAKGDEEAIREIYLTAANLGVTDFVVPGNKPDAITEIRKALEETGITPCFYAQGFVAQGGEIKDGEKAAGKYFHGIVGRGIYKAENIKEAAIELTKNL